MKKVTCFFLILITMAIPAISSAAPTTNAPLKNTPSSVPILCYHRIIPKVTSVFDLSPAMLEQQFKFFIDHGYHPITALQFTEFQKQPELFPEKPLVLTFDDGNKSHYKYVFPLLKKYSLKATFFVYPSAIVSHPSKKYLTWAELGAMSQAGMDIESHTMNHPYLTNPDTHFANPGYLKWLDFELVNAKNLLEQKLKNQVKLLAYPYGLFNQVVETKAVEAGYAGIFTVNWGVNTLSENPLRLKRRIVTNKYSLPFLERLLTTKPLAPDIITPPDASIITQIPLIQFRLKESNITSVKIQIGKNKRVLTPDRQGSFSYQPQKLRLGYNMIIISASDTQKNEYLGSWSLYYQKPSALLSPKKPPSHTIHDQAAPTNLKSH
ncbi:MAG TPA: polysaccharide deacetylase family protein [Bacillota bacterium]|nr:polysaccharide deacetylase family protein [Bacillota bacterium]